MGYDYDAAVIGGGAGGTAAARVAANLGAKVVLVEAHRLGGESTWTGCVPSKTLIRAADIVNTSRSGPGHGIRVAEPEVDFDRVIANVHRVREQVFEQSFSPDVLDALGIDVIRGRARFIDPHSLDVQPTSLGGQPTDQPARQVTARYIFVATGGSPIMPPIKGLETASVRTNATIFELRDLPESLAVIGAGPVGCEIGQAFQRLGSKVTIIESGAGILQDDDDELASMLQEFMEDEGVRFLLGADVSKIVSTGRGSILEIEQGGAVRNASADQILVAAGKRPNLTGLGLDSAGIQHSPDGIVTDERGRTNVRHIYAIGGVSGNLLSAHMTEYVARIAVTNALLKASGRIEPAYTTWTTFTDPELAHVGATESELKESGTEYQLYRLPYEQVDRALADGRARGVIKVFALQGSGRILGANILGYGAGDQIGYFALAIRHGLTMRQLADSVFPYPTYALGNRDAAKLWYGTQPGDSLSRFMQRAFRLKGDLP